jgi:hypothetical protein
MPYFPFTQLLGAGLTAAPFAQPSAGTPWNYRVPPRNSMFELLINATAVGLVMSLTTGPEAIVQPESPISAGGTAGVLPARLNVEPIVDEVGQGEEMVVTIRNTTGAGITYNLIAVLTYQARK